MKNLFAQTSAIVIAASIAVALAASTAFAAGSLPTYTTVTLIQLSANGFVTVKFAVPLTGSPCTDAANITFDGSTALGVNKVSGTGACTGGVEYLSWIGFNGG
jgi:hypothetical protein